MNIQSIFNIGKVSYSGQKIKQKQVSHTESLTENINLNNSPTGIINKNYISFKGFNNNFSYLFLNYDKVYNSNTKVLPRRYYSGYADKDIYFSDSSASVPLNQKNAWQLFNPRYFEKFLDRNPDLSDILYNSPMGKRFKEDNRNIDFQLICKILKEDKDFNSLEDIKKFSKALKTKYDIDILQEPKYYRFIGKSELVKLLKGEEVEPTRTIGYFDITTDPELNWNHFRVSFKTNDAFTNNKTQPIQSMVKEHNAEENYYYLKRPYSIDDIEKIEMASPHGLLEFDLNHKYTDEELNVIDTLMFCN